MNLIQIQERLKDVPLNSVIQYANGSNPDVPPYLALAEIQRRNSVQQQSQQAMPPDASVKEQIERRALEQSANQLMADQARQQQASQQMAQQMTQPREQIPQGVPQPEQPESVPTYASGGITSIPVRNDLFNFDRGGIVTFAEGDYVDNPFKDEEKPKTVVKKTAPKQPVAKAPNKDYMALAEEALNVRPPMPESPQVLLERAKATNPDLAKPIGEDYMSKLQALEAQDKANREAFESRETAAQRRDFWNSLIAAGEATRGGQGIGALLGGFGRSYGSAQEAADERRARQEALRREQDMNMAKLNFEVQNLRRAEARGDVDAAYKHQQNIANLEAEIQKNRATGFTNLGNLQRQKEYNDIIRAQVGQQAQPEFVRLFQFFKKQNPSLTDEQAYEMAVKYSRAGIAGEFAGERQSSKIIADIQKKYTSQIQLARQSGNKSLEETLTRQMEDEIRRATGGIPGQPGQSTVPSGFTVTREK